MSEYSLAAAIRRYLPRIFPDGAPADDPRVVALVELACEVRRGEQDDWVQALHEMVGEAARRVTPEALLQTIDGLVKTEEARRA